ncbi:hypothetical protein SS50377_28630 [Spironucleus salmonicida]|uniref:Uncharacterized protein n=1 Tax=Spironucleus salmonicida TaxID=348837 RepID=A0A9P8RUG3_9EUKA|nr:hypothetical protein SS50377_28630 [Spironucleus salmonicida]
MSGALDFMKNAHHQCPIPRSSFGPILWENSARRYELACSVLWSPQFGSTRLSAIHTIVVYSNINYYTEFEPAQSGLATVFHLGYRPFVRNAPKPRIQSGFETGPFHLVPYSIIYQFTYSNAVLRLRQMSLKVNSAQPPPEPLDVLAYYAKGHAFTKPCQRMHRKCEKRNPDPRVIRPRRVCCFLTALIKRLLEGIVIVNKYIQIHIEVVVYWIICILYARVRFQYLAERGQVVAQSQLGVPASSQWCVALARWCINKCNQSNQNTTRFVFINYKPA